MKNNTSQTLPIYMEKGDLLKHESIVTQKGVSEINKKKYQWIQLNETIFHPKGGGQPCDKGTINGINVTYVHKISLDKERLDLFEILHCFEENQLLNFKEGDKVELVVDETARTLYSRMHTAGHMIAEVTQMSISNVQPFHGNHDPDDGYVKFKILKDMSISKDEIKQKIQPELDEWTKKDYPVKIVELPSGIRAIKLCEHIMPCGGTHVKNFNQVGEIFIIDVSINNKEKTFTVKYRLSCSTTMLEKIITWGQKDENIKTLILLGSRATDQFVDKYSDYDISVFCDRNEPYTQSDDWLNEFGKVWICVHEKVHYNGKTFPTRLIIFEGGVKIDFSFYNTAFLNEMPITKEYKVILNKGNAFEIRKEESFKPSEKEFHRIIKEFWFEVYHVGIALKREDLWNAKFRSGEVQKFLLQMIEWHANTNFSDGKHMSSWVGKDLWQELHGIFAHFDAEDSWKALFKTTVLFKRISKETAQTFGLKCYEEEGKNITEFVNALKCHRE